MNINNGYFSSIEQAAGQYLNQQVNRNTAKNQTPKVSFEEILRQQWNIENESSVGELKFSKHAGERLAQRNIVLTDDQLVRLNDGATKAYEKGIKESLVIVDNLSFIVNTEKNTVITAMEQEQNDDNIYTNIDGAVII